MKVDKKYKELLEELMTKYDLSADAAASVVIYMWEQDHANEFAKELLTFLAPVEDNKDNKKYEWKILK